MRAHAFEIFTLDEVHTLAQRAAYWGEEGHPHHTIIAEDLPCVLLAFTKAARALEHLLRTERCHLEKEAEARGEKFFRASM